MKPGRSAIRLAAAVRLAAALALAGCMAEDRIPDGPSTETGNPALAGILRDTLGRPAAGALVKLYRLDPDTVPVASPFRLDSVRTGADGAYRFGPLEPANVYALEAADAPRRAFSFLPAAEVPAGDTGFLRRDTLVLKRPGRLHGIARRDSNPRPPGIVGEAGILVRVVGLDRAAYTDSGGRYDLADIPEGSYRLHYMAADGHYLGEVAGPVPVAAGAEVEMDPVVLDWSPFVAPPAPGGLVVAPDSAAAVIRLRWNRVFVSNLDHYRILRSDTLSPAPPDTFRTRDTAYADTVGHLPAGRILAYRVQAVNALGTASEDPAPRAVPVPAAEDTAGADLEIAAVVLSGSAPARALVRLYALRAAPGATDSLPREVSLVDSARAGADGRVRFAGRAAGRYTLAAAAETGPEVAARLGVPARKGGAADTLRLAAPGGLQGLATRQGLWCSDRLKQNENIEVSLAGTPWYDLTDFSGKYDLPAVPAGDYRVVVMAQPKGCFLPDTAAISIVSGRAAVLAEIPARPDPDYIPVVTSLRLVPAAGGKAALEWNPIPAAYADLQGYQAFRRDAAGAVTASSGLLAEPAWTDDVSGLPSGTVVSYVVRVVRKDGALGPPGGDWEGDPVYFTVP